MNIFQESNIKAVLALIVVLTLAGGFFLKLITAEAFLPIAGFIIQYYFHRNEMKNMQSKLDEKDGEIQALAHGKIKIIKLDNG